MERRKPDPNGRPRRTTLTDVAVATNVDPSVVSRVVNNDPRLRIRDETRQQILQAVDRLGYRPNAHARSLRTATANAFGLVIPGWDNPVYTSMVAGAEAEARQRGMMLLTATLGESYRRFSDLILQERVDGLLYVGIDKRAQVEVPTHGVPTLRLNDRAPGESRSVVLHDVMAARKAVAHLVDLGHRRIALLAGPSRSYTAERRRVGYTEELAARDLPVDPALIEETDYTLEGGAAAMEPLLDRTGFTAVVAANFASAVGALACMNRRGVHVPGDVSILSIHDHPWAGFTYPPLTTVRLPLEQLGRRGVELLATRAADEHIEEVIQNPITLVTRESCAPPT